MGFMYNALRGFIHIARLGFIYIARMGHIYHAFYLRLNSCFYHRGPPLPAPRRPRHLSRLRPLRSPPSASPGLVLPELLRPTLLAPLRPVASPCRPPSLCASPPPSLFLPTPSPRPTPFPLLMQQMHLTLVAALRAPRFAPISRLPPICGGPTTANPHLTPHSLNNLAPSPVVLAERRGDRRMLPRIGADSSLAPAFTARPCRTSTRATLSLPAPLRHLLCPPATVTLFSHLSRLLSLSTHWPRRLVASPSSRSDPAARRPSTSLPPLLSSSSKGPSLAPAGRCIAGRSLPPVASAGGGLLSSERFALAAAPLGCFGSSGASHLQPYISVCISVGMGPGSLANIPDYDPAVCFSFPHGLRLASGSDSVSFPSIMLTAHYSNILVLFAALAALVGGSMTCPRAISPGVEVCEDTCGVMLLRKRQEDPLHGYT
ncbi:hypothetical protein V8E36_002137 [Tilletia maclaganii]